MKKTYIAPAIDVKKFDVADVITTSVVASTNATIVNDGSANTVEIVAKW